MDEEYTYFCQGDFYYVIGESTFMEFRDIIAWCFDCQDMVSAENVPSISDLEDEIRALDMPGSEGYHRIFGKIEPATYLSWWKFKREKMLAWRKLRTSLASCLRCGNRRLFAFPPEEWVSHPKTNDKCLLRCVGISSGITRRCGYYDVEGNRIHLSDSEYFELNNRRKAWQEREKQQNPRS